jgi:hypothetical protein
MATRFTTEHGGKTVQGVRLEAALDLAPYEPALDHVEAQAVFAALQVGCKIEVLDERVAEIHVDDLFVICRFPNPTREDAPRAHHGEFKERAEGVCPFTDDELRELGLDPANWIVGGGGTFTTATRWSIFGTARQADWERHLLSKVVPW